MEETMSGYVEFTLPDGSSVFIESDDTESGTVKAGRLSDVTKQAQETFENAVENAHKAVLIVLDKVQELLQAPDQVEITFGLKASGELGTLVVAKAGIEANYSVKLMWKRAETTSNGSKL
jgi:hypothetical protein